MTTIILVLLLASIPGAPAPTDPAVRSPQLQDYQLGPGDVLSIHVSGVREFNERTRVSNSGRIRVPYVGVMLVAGMTPVELEGEIGRLIKEHELVNEPSVRVQIENFNSRPTYIIGEVTNPGQYVITGELYLLDLLSRAGGLLPTAADEGFLYRRSSLQPQVETRLILPGEGGNAAPKASPPTTVKTAPPKDASATGGAGEEVIPVNLNDLREGTHPELNIRLRGGDILYVPRLKAQNIYIIGDVKVPGAYTLPRRGQITAAQAVIYAGGPMATARMKNGFLVRHNDAGVREAMSVDFAAIIAGKSPDIPVRPNDIIFIPNSPAKTIGVAMLQMMPRLIQQFIIF